MLDDETRAILSRPTCSVDQVAEILGKSRAGIVSAIERKEIAATKLGNRYVIPTAPLRRMLHIEDTASAQASAA